MNSDFDKKALCITGATGYLSSNFIDFVGEELLAGYEKILLIDRTLKKERLKPQIIESSKLLFLEIDLVSDKFHLTQEKLDEINVNQVDFIHFANPGFQNIVAEEKYLSCFNQYLQKNNIDLSFFLLSSAAVYGEQESLPIHEDADLKPISDYGIYKKALEIFVKENFETYYILRFANPYGKEFEVNGVYAFFLNSIRKQAIELNENIVININAEKPKQIIRDMVYIDDFSKLLKQVLLNSKTFDKQVLNLSSSKATYVEDIALKALEDFRYQRNQPIDNLDPVLSFNYNGFKDNDIKKSVLASDKLKALIQNKSSINF